MHEAVWRLWVQSLAGSVKFIYSDSIEKSSMILNGRINYEELIDMWYLLAVDWEEYIHVDGLKGLV